MSPIALGIEVPEEKCVLKPQINRCHSAGNFSSDECLSPRGAFVVEQNAIGGVKAVSFSIIYRDPVCIEFRCRIRRARIERRCLTLRNFPNTAVKLRSRSLIE